MSQVDAEGKDTILTAATDALGGEEHFSYDALDRQERIKDHAGRENAYTWGAPAREQPWRTAI